jgi:hypothetical protein
MPSFELPLGAFLHQLDDRTTRLRIGYAKRMARTVRKVYIARYGHVFDDLILKQLAVKYGVDHRLIPLTVVLAKQKEDKRVQG